MQTAAYARYSTDQQSAASIDDQLRNCRAYCVRMGWPAPVVYSDAAISGARNDRPQYRALLSEASRYGVILVDDLSRLSRDSVEVAQAIRRLTFAGVRVIGCSDGTDTGRKGHKAEVGLRGIMSELYLSDLADKTHRGLTGKALAGKSAGGLPYGYRVTSVGERAIDESQADVVRRIYADYLSGLSARGIAAALNADGIPSPRGKEWAISAIYGDMKRGIGILANPIYIGQQIWNRSQWVKHPDTGRRVRQERSAHERVVTEHPELAIVDRAIWDAVQAKAKSRAHRPGSSGAKPKNLLSGLLRCGECGGPFVVVDRYNYGCATARDKGTCVSKVRLHRKEAEAVFLAGVREELLSDAAFLRFQRAAQAELKRRGQDKESAQKRQAEAERVRDNVMRAIREGIITPSTKAELERAEADVKAAQQAATIQPVNLLPRARERWDRLVASLGDVARSNPAATDALRALIGNATVRNTNGATLVEVAPSHLALVAGAGYGREMQPRVSFDLTACKATPYDLRFVKAD